MPGALRLGVCVKVDRKEQRKRRGAEVNIAPNLFLFVIKLYSTVHVYSLWVLGRIWGRCLNTAGMEGSRCLWMAELKLYLTSAESLQLQGLKLACLQTQHCSYQQQHLHIHLQASSLNGHKCGYITCIFRQQSTQQIWHTHWPGHHLCMSFNRRSVQLLHNQKEWQNNDWFQTGFCNMSLIHYLSDKKVTLSKINIIGWDSVALSR